METINADLLKYLNKLVNTIETQASFSLGNKKMVNKTRIDDILCCIDVNFPSILKRFQQEYGRDGHVKSFTLYEQLIANIKIKPLFGKDSYMVNYDKVVNIIPMLKQSIENDIHYIERTYSNLTHQE